LIAGIVVFLFLSIIQVPFKGTAGEIHRYFYAPVWITEPPYDFDFRDWNNKRWSISIDLNRWILEVICISLITALILFITKKKSHVSQVS
jgi:hypothetical protein